MSLNPNAAQDGEKGRKSPGEVMLSKTCQNCFSLKIRCDRTQRNDICDRCARLGKNCVFRPARRRDNSAKRDSRIQALEAQVQNLLRIQNPANTTQEPPAEDSRSAVSSPQGDGDVVDEDIVNLERADILVELYKSEMMPHFPFVIIPPHVNASTLRRDKSFLFLAVLVVASFHDVDTQERLGSKFKIMVSEKVLFGGHDCLQLEYLQGLLVVLAWNHYHGQSRYFTQYQQLAISLAVDMRLERKPIGNRPPSDQNKRNPLYDGTQHHVWGPEEMRAAAGIFYLSSTISKFLDKMNTFPCTKCIEDGCLALGQVAEYKTDQDLYHVIRLQKIIENIETVSKGSGSEAEAAEAYIRVRAELEGFRSYLNPDTSDSHLLVMQFHTAKLFLFQAAFFERNLQQSPSLHLNILKEGLEGARAFLDIYLWLPPKSELALTNAEWVQLSFGTTQAAKFAIVSKTPTVEAQTRELRQRLNIEQVFRHLALRIGALVGRSRDSNSKQDVFRDWEKRTKKVQNWYEKMARAMDAQLPDTPQTGGSTQAYHSPSHQQPYSTPSSYAHSSSSMQPSPMQPPSQHMPQVPMSITVCRPEQLPPLATSTQVGSGDIPPPMLANVYETPATSMGMVHMNSYSGYHNVPAIAFPDLINAPGWDTMFTVPMEDISWALEMPQGGFSGVNSASSPSDNGWGTPGSL